MVFNGYDHTILSCEEFFKSKISCGTFSERVFALETFTGRGKICLGEFYMKFTWTKLIWIFSCEIHVMAILPVYLTNYNHNTACVSYLNKFVEEGKDQRYVCVFLRRGHQIEITVFDVHERDIAVLYDRRHVAIVFDLQHKRHELVYHGHVDIASVVAAYQHLSGQTQVTDQWNNTCQVYMIFFLQIIANIEIGKRSQLTCLINCV